MKEKIIMIFIFLIIFCIKNYSVYGETETHKLNFENITVDDGLSQSSVNAIFQDSEGYIWIGTDDGLNRYDGHQFYVYRYDEEKISINSNCISDIFEDGEGYLWIGTSRGINKINKDGKVLETYNAYSDLSHYKIVDIMEDSNERIWVATENGLNIIDKKSKKIDKFFNEINNSNSLSSDFITSICEDINGNIWIGTNNGLNKFEVKDNKFIRYDNDLVNGTYITKVYKDNEKIYIGTKEDGLFELNIETNKMSKYNYEDLNGNISSIFKDASGNLWIGSDNGLINIKDNNFITYKNSYYDSQSLVSNNVLSITQDKSGLIWVGTYGGISIFNPNKLFTHYKRIPMIDQTLSSDQVSGIYEDDEGLIWLGTKNDGLNVLDRYNNSIKVFKKEDIKSISDNQIWQITGKGNDIWIATSNGLNKFNKNTGKFTNYYHGENENSLINNDVRSLFIDNKGILWIGTTNGVCTLDSNGNFKDYSYIFNDNNIMDKSITSIYEDEYGNMWFGTSIDGGIVKYNRDTEEVKNYIHIKGESNTISFNAIKSITGDGVGNLWIATSYGINKFNIKNEKFITYNDKNGLSNNFTYGILIDDDKNPWISTNNGICKYNIERDSFTVFDITDGLQNKEFNTYSYFKSKSGEMFFGGISGFNSFYPKNINKPDYTAKVKIESLKFNTKDINITKNIELKYDENYLNFEFFLPDFKNTAQTTYYYKLQGLDDDWIDSENRNYAKYTNIPPGNYKFLVTARSSNGNWSNPTELNIKILNPPWKSGWAYLIYLLVILLIIYIAWNYVKILESIIFERTHQLNIKFAENEELYKQVIEVEKYKNNYFVNLSHELRTPLNLILSSVQLINSFNQSKDGISRNKLEEYMLVLQRNSKRLLRLINNIIDTSKIEAGEYKLHIAKVDIIYIVEELALSMKNFVEDNGIELIIDPEVEEFEIECDGDTIERCLINLIGNAVKFTEKGGKIEVGVWTDSYKVYIDIKDTGIGIDKKYHESIFNRFSQTYSKSTEEHGGSGLGLTVTKQIIELHNGEIKVESELGKGSKFTLALPISQTKKH
ncbi:histidine kinase [Clostridium senegalense]|uniref:ligand-binding sensor domain-containing protein n=1 Tax=Clostridium senegalense TaxID=1465809 RepID=UPI001C107F3D|nr:sensor histidine kinase [Clostridium senegalense]MBU5226726.1 histidine kinase [Clostridium senegalense]